MNEHRFTDAQGQYCLDVTDCVTDKKDGKRVRVTGFYRIDERQNKFSDGSVRILTHCHPDDPKMCVVGTYAISGGMHRPWDLDWVGFIPWTGDNIAEQRKQARAFVEDPDPSINSNSYPGLLVKFPDLSGHEAIALTDWRAKMHRTIYQEMEAQQIPA